MSSNPNDLTALTPGHFLIGEPLTSIVDPHANPVKGNLLYRWKLVAHLKQEFWHRWSKEYLSELQHRQKWNKPQPNVKIGTLVIIKEDNLPLLSWPMGRIIQIFKGRDGFVRVAELKTAAGIVKRPIHKLAPLPVESKEQDTITENNDDAHHPEQEDSSKQPPGPTKRKYNTRQSRLKENNEEAQSANNKKPHSKMSTLATLFLTCFVMPLMVPGEVQIKPFETSPGLYFEDMGSTYLVTNEWDIVAFFNMQLYWSELEFIKKGTKRLTQMCTTMIRNESCINTIDQFTTTISEIETSNELLYPQRRTKREPFNFIGNVANSLFGILDSKYAEDMSEIVNNLKERQNHILELIRNLTSIINDPPPTL